MLRNEKYWLVQGWLRRFGSEEPAVGAAVEAAHARNEARRPAKLPVERDRQAARGPRCVDLGGSPGPSKVVSKKKRREPDEGLTVDRQRTFLDAITSNPDDLATRLVYADWLTEQGDPKGDFIRVQCQLEQLPIDDPQRDDLEVRQDVLLDRHRGAWVEELPKWVQDKVVRFRRGFPHCVEVTAGQFAKSGRALLKKVPLQNLRLSNLDESNTKALTAMPELARMRALELWDRSLAPADAVKFLAAPVFAGLTRLGYFLPAGSSLLAVAACLACPSVQQLRELAVGSLEPGVARLAAESVARLPFPLLVALVFGEPVRDAEVRGLCSAPFAARLSKLRFQWPTGVDGLQALTEAGALAGLRVFGLGVSDIWSEESAELFKASHFRRVVELSLNYAGVEAIRDLARSPMAGNLRILRLQHANQSPAGARALVGGHVFSRLAWLDLEGTFWNDAGAAIFAASDRFPNLRRLDLAGMSMTEKTLKALAESLHFPRLQVVCFHAPVGNPPVRVHERGDYFRRMLGDRFAVVWSSRERGLGE
jgi:uncharacterized protein (TIGR02996 family)